MSRRSPAPRCPSLVNPSSAQAPDERLYDNGGGIVASVDLQDVMVFETGDGSRYIVVALCDKGAIVRDGGAFDAGLIILALRP